MTWAVTHRAESLTLSGSIAMLSRTYGSILFNENVWVCQVFEGVDDLAVKMATEILSEIA